MIYTLYVNLNLFTLTMPIPARSPRAVSLIIEAIVTVGLLTLADNAHEAVSAELRR
jgi:hypothetical protein